MQSWNSFVGTWSFSQEIVYSEFGGSIWSCLFFRAINVLLSLPSSTLLSDQWITGKKTRKTSYYLFFLLEVKTCWQLVNCNPSPSNDSKMIFETIFETVRWQKYRTLSKLFKYLIMSAYFHGFLYIQWLLSHQKFQHNMMQAPDFQCFPNFKTSLWFVSTVDTLLYSYCLCNESKVQSIALLAYLH